MHILIFGHLLLLVYQVLSIIWSFLMILPITHYNIIRTLLIQASLPGRYWVEGLHTATYLLNRLLTKAI
jgi:hypothetical protein